jgi:hypothetical protein
MRTNRLVLNLAFPLLTIVLSLLAATPGLVSVRIVPSEANLSGADASQRFVVLGTYDDGLERDVTSGSLFRLSDAHRAKLDPNGRVTAVADGTATLEAKFAGHATKAVIRIENSQREAPVSFERDIVPIFTKNGCNSSRCHGGVKGKGGFKLSMDGIAADEDYPWIVKGGGYQVLTAEPKGPPQPRINPKQPEQSLLLLKPTFALPHGGGKRFEIGSNDYQVILNWIGNGARFLNDGETASARVKRIEALPDETVLDLGAKRQILITAYLSNGRREDVTGKAAYESLNPEIAKVTAEGLVEAVRAGETAVLIRSHGRTLNARVGVVAKPLDNYHQIARLNFIDDHVFGKLRKLHIIPSEISSDAEFLRRICLDLTGTLPPPHRAREFIADQDPQKREKLIETLLSSPEYVDFWTYRFAGLFQATPKFRAPRTNAYWEWVRQSVEDNKPYDQIAREFIGAQGYEGPSLHYAGKEPIERLVAEQVRLFLGRRLDCAQCHNHPFDVSWTQDQFWGMAAFFGRLTRTGWSSDNVVYDDAAGQEIDLGAMGVKSLAFMKVTHPRTGKEVAPRFFDGRLLALDRYSDLRTELAKQLTSHPYFAEATVNRIWNYFFGRGIVNPIDDFRADNPPTDPALLHALARDFEKHGYDLKHLLRVIAHSRTYQLSSRPNEANREDNANYSHALNRPLEAEVLMDAISDATGVTELFQAGGGQAPPGVRAINLKVPTASRFLDVFGRRSLDSKANLVQALHMLAGSIYTEKLAKPGGRIDRLLQIGASDRSIIEELYLATLCRLPLIEENHRLVVECVGVTAAG